MRVLLTVAIVLLSSAALGAPVPIILDTDIYSDVDDVGAVTVLHALADAGQAQILGLIVDTPSKWGAPCLDAIDTYFNRPDVPIGTLKPNDDSVAGHNYAQVLAQSFPNSIADGNNAPDATLVYRQLLAAQPDASVTIVGVGTLTSLQNLLQSPADATSALTGVKLVAAKVKHLVLMGGAYPSGSEFNFQSNPAATSYIVGNWPTPMVFDGFEIGATIETGSTLSKDVPSSSPVRRAYEIYVGVGNSRSSWDPSAALYAVLGTDNVYAQAGVGGHNVIAQNGSNMWASGTSSTQVYLTKTATDATIAALLETLIEHQPEEVPDASMTTDATLLSDASVSPSDSSVLAQPNDLSARVDDSDGGVTMKAKSSGCSFGGASQRSLGVLLVLAVLLLRARRARDA